MLILEMTMNYCVYCYIFDDGMTYIGLTRQSPANRHKGHHLRKHGKLMSPVARYSEKKGLRFPDMFVLYDKLNAQEAQRIEHILRTSVDVGKCLNKMPTGVGVGSLGLPDGPRLTKEQLRERDRMKCRKYKKEHREQILAYSRSHREYHKRYKEIHREELKRKNREYYLRTIEKQRIRNKLRWPKRKQYQRNRRALRRLIKLSEVKLLPFIP